MHHRLIHPNVSGDQGAPIDTLFFLAPCPSRTAVGTDYNQQSILIPRGEPNCYVAARLAKLATYV